MSVGQFIYITTSIELGSGLGKPENRHRHKLGAIGWGTSVMKEVLRSTDPVRLSWLTAMLAAEHIEAITFDTHMSIMEGSLGVLPRRLMVADADYARALSLIADAGEALA